MFLGNLPGTLTIAEERRQAYPIDQFLFSGFGFSVLHTFMEKCAWFGLSQFFRIEYSPILQLGISFLSKILVSPLDRIAKLKQIRKYEPPQPFYQITFFGIQFNFLTDLTNFFLYLFSSENLMPCLKATPWYAVQAMAEHFYFLLPSPDQSPGTFFYFRKFLL